MSEVPVIDREASGKGGKGFRLQKLRAVELILNALNKDKSAYVLSAIEHKEDVYVSVSSEKNKSDYFEEDKNYDPDSSFSLNTGIVTNTLVSFVDLWINSNMKDSVFLGFYATNKIGKERKTTLTEKESITLPENPLLEYLVEGDLKSSIIDCLKKYVLLEYEKQYSTKKGGFLEVIKKWTIKDWQAFFERIDWKFGKEDHIDLEEKLLEKIRDCPFYNSRDHKNKESIILSCLIDSYDKRQNLEGLHKFVSASDVKVTFLEVSRTELTLINEDPVWELWNSLSAPEDKRNLEEKVKSVCLNYPDRKLRMLIRRACMAKIENRANGKNKDFISMKYRVFTECEDEVDDILNQNEKIPVTEAQISDWIESLTIKAKEHIDDLSDSYNYSFASKAILKGIILDLFDECFLAFDNEQRSTAQ